MVSHLTVSVIIPVHNGENHIEKCLDALIASSYPPFEIIVVDDCSTDDTAKIAKQRRITILQLPIQSGTAAARNFGAQHAEGEVLFFIDSDVIVRRETIALVADCLQNHPEIAAVFGSYDDEPAEANFISQYRNMLHHFHHQHSDTEAFTFWAGCGAIRKKVFGEIGGFDQIRYVKPSIEDIELGYRIRKEGYRILLDKDLQVKHLKRWEFLSLLRTDIFQRAIPWSNLILKTKSIPKDLNLKLSHKISSISVALLILIMPSLFLTHTKFYNIHVPHITSFFLLIILTNLLILNRKLYSFYTQKVGTIFTIKAIPLHILYYLYSGVSFVFCWIVYKISISGLFYHSVEDRYAKIPQKNP
ncbi:MAG TPA: glycosyltransferase family 2 protein [Candidatus Wunengus sp. YC60]|uniref:glycosyltransferase family 2 protein n=1 Tax=Candidatus Wunengus sp. YC60 TaxID=3367697 RepID=UPI0040285ADA